MKDNSLAYFSTLYKFISLLYCHNRFFYFLYDFTSCFILTKSALIILALIYYPRFICYLGVDTLHQAKFNYIFPSVFLFSLLKKLFVNTLSWLLFFLKIVLNKLDGMGLLNLFCLRAICTRKPIVETCNPY